MILLLAIVGFFATLPLFHLSFEFGERWSLFSSFLFAALLYFTGEYLLWPLIYFCHWMKAPAKIYNEQIHEINLLTLRLEDAKEAIEGKDKALKELREVRDEYFNYKSETALRFLSLDQPKDLGLGAQIFFHEKKDCGFCVDLSQIFRKAGWGCEVIPYQGTVQDRTPKHQLHISSRKSEMAEKIKGALAFSIREIGLETNTDHNLKEGRVVIMVYPLESN